MKFLKIYSLLHYTPNKYLDPSDYQQVIVNEFLIGFKNGAAFCSRLAVKMLCDKIRNTLEYEDYSLTLIPIPASSPQATKARYEFFCKQVCEEGRLVNGYQWIKNDGCSEKKHLSEHHSGETTKFILDKENLKGKKVVLFDDVMTKGSSILDVVAALEKIGAEVVAAFVLGETTFMKDL